MENIREQAYAKSQYYEGSYEDGAYRDGVDAVIEILKELKVT